MTRTRLIPIVVVVVLLVLLGLLWGMQRRAGPELAISGLPAAVGRAPLSVSVDVKAPSGGLDTLEALVRQGSETRPLPAPPHEGKPVAWTGTIPLDVVALGLKEGPAELLVSAKDAAWRPSAIPAAFAAVPFTVDLTPPAVEFLSATTYVKHAGAGLVVFRAVGASKAAVQVGKQSFPAESGLSADPAVRVALYTIPYRDPAADPRIVAEDDAGNSRTLAVGVTFLDAAFGTDEIKLEPRFLERKVPELDPQTPGEATTDELLQRFLKINGEGRIANEAVIREATTAGSSPKPLWSGAFRQQPNSQVFAGFPQKRTYFFGGKKVDEQWHLGIDLGSNKHSVIEASNAGNVVHAAANGIYGNLVILDHGLGLYSLYGHLSDMTVTVGQHVAQGEALGHSGETGSAAGDHLHFGMLIRGVYTNPIEWLDAGWIHDRIGKPLAEAGLSVAGITDLPEPSRGAPPRKAAAPKKPAKRKR